MIGVVVVYEDNTPSQNNRAVTIVALSKEKVWHFMEEYSVEGSGLGCKLSAFGLGRFDPYLLQKREPHSSKTRNKV